MKIYLIVYLLLFSNFFVCSQNLKGKVVKIVEKNYERIGNSMGLKDSTICEFGKNKITIRFNLLEKLTTKVENDSAGNLIQLIEINHRGDTIYKHWILISSPELKKDSVTGKIGTSDASGSTTITYKNGKPISEITDFYYKSEKIHYTYDNQQNLIEKYYETIPNRMPPLPSKYTYKYDQNHNKIEEIIYERIDNKDVLYSKDIYTYDTKNQMIKHQGFTNSGSMNGVNYEYSYDDKGNQMTWFSYNTLWKVYYTYDEHNKLSKSVEYRSNDGKNYVEREVYEYLTHYDKQGNWIYNECKRNNKTTYINQREIEYQN